jgi:hypothetical protein
MYSFCFSPRDKKTFVLQYHNDSPLPLHDTTSRHDCKYTCTADFAPTKLDRKTFVTTPEANTAATFARETIQIILCRLPQSKKRPQVSAAKFILGRGP